MAREGRRSGRGRSLSLGSKNKLDLNTVEGLETLAKAQGKEPPEEKKPFSALRKIGGILNVGTAATAGATRGALRKDTSVFEGISQGVKNRETFGFSNILREDLGFDPKTRAGKVGLATAGFAADVLFDPLTYLTFGAAAGSKAIKIGRQAEKTLSAPGIFGLAIAPKGSKLFQKASSEIIDASTQKLLKQGMKIDDAARVAINAKGENMAKYLMDIATESGKRKLTTSNADQFLKEGVEKGTLQTIMKLGPNLLDRGGIKFMGQHLIKSTYLADKTVGRAARALGEVEVVKALKTSLSKLFVADFSKNPKLVQILDKGTRDVRQAIDEIVDANEQLFKGLSDDQMSKLFNEIFSKKLKVADKASGAARQAAKAGLQKQKLKFPGEPQLQKIADTLFEGKDAIVPRFAELAGLPKEDAIKFYIPSKFRDQLNIKDFSVGRVLRNSDLNFLKKFSGFVNERLIRDPKAVYTLGQAEIMTAKIKDDTFTRVIQNLGKNSADDVFTTKITRKGIGGRKLEGYFPEDIAKEINQFLTPKEGAIDELFRASGFDYVTGIFKGYVTSLFPGFHVRNITSNQFQNMLRIGVDTLNPGMQAQAAAIVSPKIGAKIGKNLDDIITTKTGAKMTLREIRNKIAEESDILEKSSSAFNKLEQFQQGQNVLPPTFWQKANPLSRENAALAKGRQFGGASEAQAKVVSVISAVMQGKTVKEGVKQAEDALFNYGKLTDFEKSIMRRMIPFYTWSRKNAEFQIKALARTPGAVAAEIKAFKNASTAFDGQITEEDIQGMPHWVLESLGIKAGVNQYGQDQVITGFGLPIEEFLGRFSGDKGIVTNTIKKTLSQVNPIIKFPTERATGIDFFRGRPITEIDNAQDLKVLMDAMPEGLSNEFKELIQYHEKENVPVFANGKIVDRKTKVTANPFVLHLIRNLPTSRAVATTGFVTDPGQTEISKALRFFTGVRGWSIDQETQKYFNDLQRKEELFSWMKRAGLVGNLDIVFETK